MTGLPWLQQREIGGYQLISPLSAGGMGQVFLARRKTRHGFEKLVAVKVVHDRHEASDSVKAMFLDEARLVARLDHPGIAQVYDFGEQDGALFLVMEYVEGLTFRQLLTHKPPAEVVALAMQEVCRALHAAHELVDRDGRRLGVVHRDVSPENLMLTFAGRVKVLDFGIALRHGRSAPATMVGEIRGKPSYMAPEQLQQGSIDCRADVFAAGLVFLDLLIGQPVCAHNAATRMATDDSPLLAFPPLPASTPPAIAAVIERALQLDPDDRYPSAHAMAEEIGNVLDPLEVQSLERYAGHALREERERVGRWMRACLEGAVSTPPTHGRPTAIGTVPAGETASKQRSAAVAKPARRQLRLLPIVLPVAVLAATGLFFAARPLLDQTLGMRTDEKSPAFPRKPQSMRPTAVKASPTTPTRPSNAAPQSADSPAPTTSRKEAPASPKQRKTPRAARQASARPVSKSVGFGHITVGAEPYAIVWIDGEQVGTTPLLRHRLTAGEHTIRFVSPDDGRTRETRVVRVGKGSHQKIVAR